MKSADIRSPRKQSIFFPAGWQVINTIAAFLIISGLGILTGCTRQAQVAARGSEVMPFDLEQTIHLFERLDDGGRQTVTAKDPSNEKQIALIQAHLRQEAEKFGRGDFSAPAKIHGDDMPGLAELKSGSGLIDIQYKALPTGGEIRYTTGAPSLVKALHQWFMAQVSDHGKHATDH